MRRFLAIGFLGLLLTGCSLKEKLLSLVAKKEASQVETEKTSRPEKKEKKVLAELTSEEFEAGKNWVVARGTIKNSGEEVVEIGEVSAAAYDQEGKVVGAASGLAFPPVLFPSQEALVGIFIDETGRDKGQIKEAKVRFSFEATKARVTPLKVINFTGKPGENSPYVITGEVENQFPQKVEKVRAILMFYDTQEKLMSLVEVPLEPDFILPGETAPFRKVCTDEDVWLVESEKFRPVAFTSTLIAPPSPVGPVIRVGE